MRISLRAIRIAWHLLDRSSLPQFYVRDVADELLSLALEHREAAQNDESRRPLRGICGGAAHKRRLH